MSEPQTLDGLGHPIAVGDLVLWAEHVYNSRINWRVGTVQKLGKVNARVGTRVTIEAPGYRGDDVLFTGYSHRMIVIAALPPTP